MISKVQPDKRQEAGEERIYGLRTVKQLLQLSLDRENGHRRRELTEWRTQGKAVVSRKADGAAGGATAAKPKRSPSLATEASAASDPKESGRT